jgi:hypothetical protein
MGVRRISCGLAALVLLTACGDPASVSSDTESSPDQATGPVPATGDEIAVCTDPPFVVGPEEPSQDLLGLVSPWVDGHPELFAGMWWDTTTGEFVFAATDVERSMLLIGQELPPDLVFRIELVTRNATQLAALQTLLPTLVDYGIVASGFPRVWDAVVEIDLPILDESTLNAVREVFVGELDAICVTGADPSTVPPAGPQPTVGDGWRLLADQVNRGDAYSVHVAVNEAEYTSLWESLSLDGKRPPVDFSNEIVVYFGAVYSGSCPEIRLDGVNFDLDRALVSAGVVVLGGNRVCTADANPRAYVVAVDKSRLPALPFGVSLQPDCSYCAHVEVSSFEGTQSPEATLSEFDRWQILGAAAVDRLGVGGTGYTTVNVVEVLGRATSDGFVNLDDGTLLTESERNAITQALGPRTVQFVTVAEWETSASDFAVLSIAEPVVLDGQLTITTAMWCGSLCGAGGASAVERLDDGTWTITGPVGPQWNS